MNVSDLIHNERAKLTATWLNTMGAAAVVLGAITPATLVVASFETGVATPWGLLWGAVIWIPAGFALHWFGRRVLRRLRQ